jgi:hypothetical protein
MQQQQSRLGVLRIGSAAVLALALSGMASLGAERRMDLDGNPLNGEESRIVTRVLQTFPVEIENTIYNNAVGQSFVFSWPGAGPGGFDSYVTPGPDVGTIWRWTSVSQIYSLDSPAIFTPDRTVPVVGSSGSGVQVPGSTSEASFIAPGKSVDPTQVTLSTASLVASLITFFSPKQTAASCGVDCESGECSFFVQNLSGGTANFSAEQPDCCLEPQQLICNGECRSYLTDPDHCGDCGVQCGPGEFCSNGTCVCPEGQTQCGSGCVDLLADPLHCGACGTECGVDQFCSEGDCACLDAGLAICDGTCVDLQTDDLNCGACGVACDWDQYCGSGTCQDVCPGQDLCGDECVDLLSDPMNCGSCGNVCGSNDICTEGACVTCRPPLETACDNKCVSIRTDPFNCGGCGNVCDFTDCPSTGQGTCSQGASCVCDPATESSLETLRFDPVPSPPEARTRVHPLQAAPAASRSRRGDATVKRASRALPVAERSGAIESTSFVHPDEAPLCELQPLDLALASGETFSQSLGNARYGREVFTTVTITEGNDTIARGPCPLIVPVTEPNTDGVILSPVDVVTMDSSGDGLCQPGEALCDFLITAVQVGDSPCLAPAATLSSPANSFNPNDITFLNAQAGYPDWPAYPGEGEPLQQGTNDVAFSITGTESQPPDHGRAFLLTVQCANLPEPVEMPIVLGFGSACDPTAELDGETYDGINGFQSPVSASLAPEGSPLQFSSGNFNQGSTIPLKLSLTCGPQNLSGGEIDPKPQIVGLLDENGVPQSLAGINGDNNANPDDPEYICGSDTCDYQFRTEDLSPGTYVISVQMPDTRIFQAGLTIRP